MSDECGGPRLVEGSQKLLEYFERLVEFVKDGKKATDPEVSAVMKERVKYIEDNGLENIDFGIPNELRA